MIALTLALLLATDPDAAALVAQLGTASDADRPAVAAQLEALGLKAVPALRAARDAKDATLRRRASALLERIETGLLIRPSLVALDFQEQTVTDAIKGVSAQTGFSFALEPAGDPAWQAVRVNLREPRPLPFWEALDRFGAVARLHHDPAGSARARDRTPVFRLREGLQAYPVSHSGPFRVSLLSVHRRHDLVFEKESEDDDDAPEPEPEQFEVIAQVFAEPRLIITLNGGLKELKARDDFDQDLVPPRVEPTDDTDAAPLPPMAAGIERGPGLDTGALSIVQFPIALHAPERPGTTIERLEGFVPLQAALRRPDPITITLAEAAGGTFANDDLSLRLPKRKLELTSRVPLELFVTLKNRPGALMPDDTPIPPNFPESRPVDTLQNRLEFVDAAGKPLLYRLQDVQTDDMGESRVLVVLSARDARAVPVQLRLYTLIVGAIEVPFKFKKVPMP